MTILQVVVVLSTLLSAANALQCKDENSKDVDWYVLYKLPQLKSSPNTLIQQGLAYAYITSDNVARGWTMSTLSIGDPKSAPGRTLAPLYNVSSLTLFWALYNDQPPVGEVVMNLGHTKGGVVTKADGGYWLIHSVPHFPPQPADNVSYAYPSTGHHYGQSFLCVSLHAHQMDLVGTQLTYNEPAIFASNAPSNMATLMPHLYAAARNKRIAAAPWFHQVELTTRAGHKFLSFAKSAKFQKDLYADWVAASLQVNLLVESWLNGQGKLPSNCQHQYSVENVATVGLTPAQVNFSTHLDHSKWATAEDRVKPWVCVGDINREAGQFIRGGGTVCLSHAQLWAAYRVAITAVEPCPAMTTSTKNILVSVEHSQHG